MKKREKLDNAYSSAELQALINQQTADRAQDWRLTRARDVTSKTSRHTDPAIPPNLGPIDHLRLARASLGLVTGHERKVDTALAHLDAAIAAFVKIGIA